MIIILSPAKTLDFDQKVDFKQFSEPRFLNEASQIMNSLVAYEPNALSQLMKISDKLAQLNVARHHAWSFKHDLTNALQAIYVYRGEVYNGLNVDAYTREDLAFAQNHIRILSGLYGVLRPLDLIQPYRLEMGTKLQVEDTKDLYKYWDIKIAEALNADAFTINSEVLVNLASNEYSRAAFTNALKLQVITPVFKEFKNGRYSVVAIYAKKARGLMTSWVVKNRLDNVEQMKHFDMEGYGFDANQSNETEWVFTR